MARLGFSRTSRFLALACLVGVLVVAPTWWIQSYTFGNGIGLGYTAASDFRAAVEFLRPRLAADDLFVGHPALASQLDSRRHGIGWTGEAATAKYLEIDGVWRFHSRMNAPDLVRDWPVVFTSGEITIYQNPAFAEKR